MEINFFPLKLIKKLIFAHSQINPNLIADRIPFFFVFELDLAWSQNKRKIVTEIVLYEFNTKLEFIFLHE